MKHALGHMQPLLSMHGSTALLLPESGLAFIYKATAHILKQSKALGNGPISPWTGLPVLSATQAPS